MEPPLAFHVREQQSHEPHDVRKVNEAAFGRSDEADLIEKLREEGVVLLSLVAELDSRIIGHVLFTRMTIETAQGALPAVALAPMAVVPGHQGRGVGSRLIRDGLEELRARGERIVLVLGHKHYYPRFGFASAKAEGLSSPFPPDVFMALELSEGALDDVRGLVRYPAAFGL